LDGAEIVGIAGAETVGVRGVETAGTHGVEIAGILGAEIVGILGVETLGDGVETVGIRLIVQVITSIQVRLRLCTTIIMAVTLEAIIMAEALTMVLVEVEA